MNLFLTEKQKVQRYPRCRGRYLILRKRSHHSRMQQKQYLSYWLYALIFSSGIFAVIAICQKIARTL